jgi:hypothetical protein
MRQPVVRVSVDIRKITPQLAPPITPREGRVLRSVDRALRRCWAKRAPRERPQRPPARIRRARQRWRPRRQGVTRLRRAARDGPEDPDSALKNGGLP